MGKIVFRGIPTRLQIDAKSCQDRTGQPTTDWTMNTRLKKKMAEIGAKTNVCFRVVFADGSSWQNHERAPEATIIIRSVRAAWRVLLFGHVGFLEAYFNGDIDMEGSLALAFRAALDAGFDDRPTFLVRVRNWWHELLYSNASIARAKANARFHYGPGQGFYREWLDEVGMAYTCSWFMDGTKTLEEAQTNKMDHVCRKVLLKAGDTFADIGSGWGNLLFYAWEKYGARGTSRKSRSSTSTLPSRPTSARCRASSTSCCRS